MVSNLEPFKPVIWYFHLLGLVDVVNDDPEIPSIAALKVGVVQKDVRLLFPATLEKLVDVPGVESEENRNPTYEGSGYVVLPSLKPLRKRPQGFVPLGNAR